MLLNNTSGGENTANGAGALFGNTTGNENTADGFQALYSNTEGEANTANGFQALMSNTTGFFNVGLGHQALFSNTTGTRNLAVCLSPLASLTSGDSNTAVGNVSLLNSGEVNFNTAVGRRALYRCQGDQNIGLGFFAGSNLNDGSNNNIYIGNVGPVPIGAESNTIRIVTQTPSTATVGNPPVESHIFPAHTATFIAGIYGTTVSRGATVFVDANGRLGTRSSSQRFKDDIRPMDKTSEAVLALKPVTFRYKKEIDAERTPQFGLLAEDVEKINPDLVVKDAEGKVYTVRYEAVNAMLLNEFLKEHRKNEEQQATIAMLKSTGAKQEAIITQLKTTDASQEATIAKQQKQIEALTAGLQKVSTQLELRESAPQTALNNQ